MAVEVLKELRRLERPVQSSQPFERDWTGEAFWLVQHQDKTTFDAHEVLEEFSGALYLF
ncbi:MAG TPA: hypothetical protein VIN58_21465 [Roseateles sp.]